MYKNIFKSLEVVNEIHNLTRKNEIISHFNANSMFGWLGLEVGFAAGARSATRPPATL